MLTCRPVQHTNKHAHTHTRRHTHISKSYFHETVYNPLHDFVGNGDIRLVGGNSYRGRVEVYYSGQWRTACYSGWDSRESIAVCKQLGFTGVLSTTSVYTYASSSNKTSVSCSSGVSSLHSCSISLYCSSSYQPSVECTHSSE